MYAVPTLALLVLLGCISVMVYSKPTPNICIDTDVCSSKIASAAKWAALNYNGAKGKNDAFSFPDYDTGVLSNIDIMSACKTADTSGSIAYDMTIQLHRLNSAMTEEAFCKVVKVRVTEGLKGKDFKKVTLAKDSSPNDTCQAVAKACQTIKMSQKQSGGSTM